MTVCLALSAKVRMPRRQAPTTWRQRHDRTRWLQEDTCRKPTLDLGRVLFRGLAPGPTGDLVQPSGRGEGPRGINDKHYELVEVGRTSPDVVLSGHTVPVFGWR
jgi:hypothetical protein